jgi:transcriptional regulator with XRE-family HTH domain
MYPSSMKSKIFDPTQDPVVPYFVRLRKELNLTQETLAREANVSRLALLRNEHLCYPTPFPAIATQLALLAKEHLDIEGGGNTVKHITHEYHIDVMRRRRYASILIPYIKETEDANFYLSKGQREWNFSIWRTSYCRAVGLSRSIVSFSSLICVNPSTIRNFEIKNASNDSKPVAIPRTLDIAFREMGYPNSFLMDMAHSTSELNYDLEN